MKKKKEEVTAGKGTFLGEPNKSQNGTTEEKHHPLERLVGRGYSTWSVWTPRRHTSKQSFLSGLGPCSLASRCRHYKDKNPVDPILWGANLPIDPVSRSWFFYTRGQ